MNPYSQMQRGFYDGETLNNWQLWRSGFPALDAWADWEWLMQPYDPEKIVLDFGCGLGRHVAKYSPHFKRVDGVDISPEAITVCKAQFPESNFYVADGTDIAAVPSDTYDIVCSMTVLQHICVHEIRQSLFKDFFRVLKSGGYIAIQMGFGSPSPHTVDYYANYYEAPGTNRVCDTEVASPDQLQTDLELLGYYGFESRVGPVGPGDYHPAWIYFRARKP